MKDDSAIRASSTTAWNLRPKYRGYMIFDSSSSCGTDAWQDYNALVVEWTQQLPPKK
jgi:hypothetical protein